MAKQGIYTYWAEPAQEAVWTPFSQDYSSQMYVEMRTAVDPAAFAAVVREQVRALDPDMPIFRISTMATFFRDRAMLGPRRPEVGLSSAVVKGVKENASCAKQ